MPLGPLPLTLIPRSAPSHVVCDTATERDVYWRTTLVEYEVESEDQSSAELSPETFHLTANKYMLLPGETYDCLLLRRPTEQGATSILISLMN